MKTEVRFYHMIPEQVVRRREKCPIAYLPVGALEWHGAHLPFGTDCMTVDNLAVKAAQKFGGIAFPVMAYGDVRYNLHDARKSWHQVYSRDMKLDPALTNTFVFEANRPVNYHRKKRIEPVSIPMSCREQSHNCLKQIAYALMEICLYGFKGIVVLPGHGGTAFLVDYAMKVFLENASYMKSLRTIPVVRKFFYIEACKEIEPRLKKNWIHADKWESSFVLAIEPESVHPEKLPEDPREIPHAYLGEPYLHPKTGYSKEYEHWWENFDALDPRNMNAAYGKKQLACALKALGKEIHNIKKEL